MESDFMLIGKDSDIFKEIVKMVIIVNSYTLCCVKYGGFYLYPKSTCILAT